MPPVNTHRSFFLTRMLMWLVLLLAAWGIVQYAAHMWVVLRMQGVQPVATGVLLRALAWDGLYMLLAALSVMAAAGGLMWKSWARTMLRALAVILAVYFLAGAIMLFAQWQGSDPAGTALLARGVSPELAHALAARLRRILLMGALMKALAAPVLAWLFWRLGKADAIARYVR